LDELGRAEVRIPILHIGAVSCSKSSQGSLAKSSTVVTISGWKMVEEGSEQQESPQRTGFSIQVGEVGTVDLPESIIRSPWSFEWKQPREDSEQTRALEERFEWMTEADVPISP
jgi:hypothetical protein